MAVTLTVNTDHTASLSSRYLARQGEVGVLMTVTVPAAVYALGTYAYIDFTDADGVASYLGDYDASSGSFVVSVGSADNILAKDGIVKIQFVLRDNLISESYTAVWKSQIVEAIVERSVNADTYAIPAAMPSDDPPETYEASRVSIEDVGTYYASNNVEDALQEAAVDIASNTGRISDIEAVNDPIKSAIVDLIYPVGAIYISVVSTSPATLFGGTWAAFGAGKTLVGLDASDAAFDTVEETGGAKTHTHALTSATAQITSASDGIRLKRVSKEFTPNRIFSATSPTDTAFSTSTSVSTALAGSTDAGSSLQPYIVTYMWKRTA